MKKIISTNDGVTKGLFNTFRKIIPPTAKLVTNSDVRSGYIQNLYESNFLPSSALKLIEKLVAREKIIPVECTEEYIKKLNKTLSGDACMNPKEFENVLGFYTGRQNRLYILLDNIQRLSKNDKNAISSVTIHELQHMSCYNYMKEFSNTWGKELYNFYAYFAAFLYKSYISGWKSTWNSLSGKDRKIIKNLLDPDNGIKYFVNYLMYNNEYLYACAGASITSTDCRSIGQKFSIVLSDNGCNENVCASVGKNIAEMVYDIFCGRIGTTYKKQENLNIIRSFAQAYIKTFGKNPLEFGDFIYQEMVFPSEVICVASTLKKPTDSRYYKFLNLL